ncbi:MAG: DUF4783 domain-containing protein [Bacteroidota bacterium]
MKRIAATLLFIVASHFTIAQDRDIEDIGVSLRNGSARELVKFCGSSVILKMNGETATYRKAEAEEKLRTFFLNNPPEDFNYIHQGSSSEGLKYCIGKYVVNNGAFRVVLLLKQQTDGFLLDTITLTEE